MLGFVGFKYNKEKFTKVWNIPTIKSYNKP